MKYRRRQFEQYANMIGRLYPELIKETDDLSNVKTLSRTVTFQVTDDCNLACSYCYQINKGKRKMPFETAKKYIDLLLSGDKGFLEYINPETSPAITIEFIGGEPFLEIELIEQICEYFFNEAIRLEHPWAERHMFSICSNGIMYNDPRVQRFLKKYEKRISFSITIDGNKELHDSCRRFHDGSPSYDIASAAAKDWMSRGNYMGSKITIAPENITHLFEALKHFIGEMGYNEVNCNCVYEEGWKPEHATELYWQLKKTADYLLENDYEQDVFVSIFDEYFFTPKPVHDVDNWCFRAGTMVHTIDGSIPIEEVTIGTKVRTADGFFNDVRAVAQHEAKNGVCISARGMVDTFTTMDHPYLTKMEGTYGNPTYRPVEKLNVGDLIALDVPERHKCMHTDIDKHTAFLMGAYLIHGAYIDDDYVFVCRSYTVYLAIIEALYNVGIPYNVYMDTSEASIADSAVWYVYLIEGFKYISKIGTNKKNFVIPQELLHVESDLLDSFIDGLTCGDGDFIFGVFNPSVLNDILTILRIRHLFYDISELYDHTDTLGLIIGGINTKAKNTKMQYEHIDRYGEVCWVPIQQIRPVDGWYTVYNMTVTVDHTFIANGAIVHNCGGTGLMLSCDPDGYLYPCIRYMESSLGCDRPPYRIGHVDTGIGHIEEYDDHINCLNCIDRRSQSTDECFYCPIANGCSWCSAYNYQVNGTPDSRVTYICEMHKARALANAYLWAKIYAKRKIDKLYRIFIPEEWALKIIPKEEWEMLINLPYTEVISDPELIRIAQHPNVDRPNGRKGEN